MSALRAIRERHLQLRLLFAFMLLFTGYCLLRAGDDVPDSDRMQGIWQVISLTEKGKDVPKAETEILEVVINKDNFSVSEKNVLVVRYRVKLDPAKRPKEIDFTHLIGENKDKTEPGIYAFEADVLKLVLNEDRKGRPRGFEGKETASYSVMVLKRKTGDKEMK